MNCKIASILLISIAAAVASNNSSVHTNSIPSAQPTPSTVVTPSVSSDAVPAKSSSYVVPSSSSVHPSSAMVLPSSTKSAIHPSTHVASSSTKSSVHPSSHVAPSSKMHSASVKPSPSSSIAPHSSVAPTNPPVTTSKPDVHQLNFHVKEHNKTCILLAGHIDIVVTEGEKSKVISLTEAGGSASGACSSANVTTSYIELSWTNVTLTVHFDSTKDMWYMSGVAIEVVADDKKTVASHKYDSSSNSGLFQAKNNHSYACSTDQKLKLSANSTTVVVDFKNVQMQPFEGEQFINAAQCPAKTDDNPSSSVVPIAVGGALAGLIVIVLIAYLIGRRRGDRGYQRV